MAGYIEVFNYFDPAKGWTAGSVLDYDPPNRIYLGTGAWAIVYGPNAGVILYDVIDLPALSLVAVGAVATVSAAQVADLLITVGK